MERDQKIMLDEAEGLFRRILDDEYSAVLGDGGMSHESERLVRAWLDTKAQLEDQELK